MAVSEAKKIFLGSKKKYSDTVEKKSKLELRLQELEGKFEGSAAYIVSVKKERQKVVEAIALGNISDGEYKRAIEKLAKSELEHSALGEQIEIVKNAITDTGDLLSEAQKQMNESQSSLYGAIVEELTEQIKQKMPTRDLQMLSICKLRSGSIWGRDGWASMLNDVTGGGRFETSEIAAEIEKKYGI